MSVHNIEENEPHVVVRGLNEAVYIIPLSIIKRIAAGEVPVEQLEEHEQVIPKIIDEWLRFLGK